MVWFAVVIFSLAGVTTLFARHSPRSCFNLSCSIAVFLLLLLLLPRIEGVVIFIAYPSLELPRLRVQLWILLPQNWILGGGRPALDLEAAAGNRYPVQRRQICWQKDLKLKT